MSKLKNKNGDSIVIALVVMLVATLTCLSLFLTMSAFIGNVGQKKDREQARILAASLSEVIQKEISSVTVDSGGGEPRLVIESESLAEYLYNNIGNGWAWYNEDETLYQNKAAATRKFNETVQLGENGKTADVLISMYWTSSGENELSGNYSQRELFITVTVTVNGFGGGQSCSLTSHFEYSVVERNLFWWNYTGEME